MKNKGFTFAEVLITLGIIGVVAAMTIPGLIQNSKNKELQTKLINNQNKYINSESAKELVNIIKENF